MSDLWAAIAIALILEGMMPFISPNGWKQAILKISQLPDKQIRSGALIVMVCGVILLSLVRTGS